MTLTNPNNSNLKSLIPDSHTPVATNWTNSGYFLSADADYNYNFALDKSIAKVQIQVVWTGVVGGSTGTATLEQSANNNDWSTVQDTGGNDVQISVTGTASHDVINITNAAPGFYRIKYLHGDNDGGSISVNIAGG